MSFQKGDKVKIRKDLKDGWVYHPAEIVTPEMIQYAGTETTIMRVSVDGTCKLDCDNGEWYWPEETLIPSKITNADKIRSMSNEELAEIIMCPYDTEPDLCKQENGCLNCCLDWLRKPTE